MFELIKVISSLGTFQSLLDLKSKMGFSSTTFRKVACIQSVLGSLHFDHCSFTMGTVLTCLDGQSFVGNYFNCSCHCDCYLATWSHSVLNTNSTCQIWIPQTFVKLKSTRRAILKIEGAFKNLELQKQKCKICQI